MDPYFKAEFPALKRRVHGKPLVYLDNAATTLKPRRVVEAVKNYYQEKTANVHRGVHLLAQEATTAYEASRERVKKFLNANSEKEIVFTAGATDSLNLLAHTLAAPHYTKAGKIAPYLQAGDEVIVSEMEHHSNLVPWQLLKKRFGIVIKVVGVQEDGQLNWEEYEKLLCEKTKLVCLVWVSNALGTINPMKALTQKAHQHQALVVADAAQALSHFPIDVQAVGVDFLVASAHKAFGPTGVGILYGKQALLEKLPPYRGGGEMVLNASLKTGFSFKAPPTRFEAGTPNIAGVIGFGAALEFINEIGFSAIQAQEKKLLAAARELLLPLSKVRFFGSAPEKVPIFSFLVDGVHAHDVGSICDEEGVAIRTGHHCTQPLMERYQVPATTRASLACYNSPADLAALVESLKKAQSLFYAPTPSPTQ